MEKKINIAEIIKGCPKGMELDCTMYDRVTFDEVTTVIGFDDKKRVKIILSTHYSDGTKDEIILTEYGTYTYDETAKCVIFPKGKTTWEGFQRPFKDGDIVTYKYENGLVSMILNKFVNFVEVHYHCALYDNAKGFVTNNYIVGEPKYTHHATEEEKQRLFDAIKDNGYRWNAETKTLEKLPKFKVGDRIVDIYRKHLHCDSASGKISKITDDKYIFDDGSYIHIQCQDNWELASNKFDITTLKPFDKVLVRGDVGQKWTHDLFGFMDKDKGYPFVCVGHYVNQCVPYENNEHLLGTTNDCDDYFKTWI